MINIPPWSWLHSGGMRDCSALVFLGFKIPATTWCTTVWFVLLWRGDTRRLRVSTFRLGGWQWHLMMCPVCCISPLRACFCPTSSSHRTTQWIRWWGTWGLIWVMLFLRWLIPKVHIFNLAPWGWFSRSVCWSSWRWRMSMVWLRRCGACGTKLSAHIFYTWSGSRSSLTRAKLMWMLSTWGTIKTLILLLNFHGELGY